MLNTYVKTIVGVLAINAVFYAYFRIATFHFHLSHPLFMLGCVVLMILVGSVWRIHARDLGRNGKLD